MTVRDDGRFRERDEEEREARYGFDGMRRRASEMEGSLDVSTENGTTISVRIPLL